MPKVYKIDPKSGRRTSHDATKISFAFTLPAENAVVAGLVQKAVASGAISETIDGITSYFIGYDYLDAATLLVLHSIEDADGNKLVSIEDLPPLYIKMSATKYKVNVPVGIHGRTYFDAEDNEIVRGWDEWKTANNNHDIDIEGTDRIVPGDSMGGKLNIEEVQVLDELSGYTMLLKHEVRAITVNDTPEG